MGWFSDLLQGIPPNVVLKERVALAEQKFKEIEQEKKKLEEKVAALEAENIGLKQQISTTAAQSSQAKPKIKWGCYVFEGEEGLYCPGCFDSNRKKCLTTRLSVHRRKCSVCRTELGAG